MKHTNILPVLVLLQICFSCSQPVRYDKRLTDALLELDKVILQKDLYENDKEQRINGIRELLGINSQPEYQYDICNKLYQEYFDYNLDSAMVYAKRKLALAREAGNIDLINESIMNLSDACILSGMLYESHELLKSISYSSLSPTLQPEYYGCHHLLYKHKEMVCNDPELRKKYEELKESYRRKVYELLQGNEYRHTLIKGSLLRYDKKYQEVVQLFLALYEQPELTLRQKSTLSFLIARAYLDMNDKENAMYYYAVGAACDIRIPLNEHESLYKLSSLIFEKGDLERAYRYINCSMEGVLQVNSRKNIYNINQMLPLISQAYNAEIERQKSQLIVLVAGFSILLLLLIGAVFIIYKNLKKISQTRREQHRTNEELKQVNTKLTRVNNTLLEANNIKEAYIGRYLDLCSNYMSGVEQYRVHLNNILRKDGSTEVVKALRSATYMKDELDEFYMNFDVTFLHIFPDFVEQFNELLQEDKRINLKPGELLTTELRVFALIRLGITDSVKIAEFLRRSTSTIYNYRVKMRNAALNERQDFENQVINIGTIGI